MCLSGEIQALDSSQWEIVERAMALYRRAVPIIKNGVSRKFGEISSSWRHPCGWQAVIRMAEDGRSALVVAHSFAEGPEEIRVPLPGQGTWQIEGHLANGDDRSEVIGDTLRSRFKSDFSAQIVLLKLL
jgi:alpha-galactosidase